MYLSLSLPFPVRGFVPVPKEGRLVGKDTACVRVTGRRSGADGVGRSGTELDGRFPISGGSLGLAARPCVRAAACGTFAEKDGRLAREVGETSSVSGETLDLEDRRCVGVAACATCAVSGVGRSGREVGSSKTGRCSTDKDRSDVGVGGRAGESKDEDGRMDVTVGRSVVERKVEDGP